MGYPAVTVSLRGVADVIVGVEALVLELHSGLFGGAAPGALAALVAMLATLRDARGNTTVRGLDNTPVWPGAAFPPATFRADAGVLDGVSLLGDGTVADMVWSRPAVTIVGRDCPPGGGVGTRDHAAGERPPEPARPARDADRRGSRGARQPAARRCPWGST